MSSQPLDSSRDEWVLRVRGVSKCHRLYAKPIHRLWQGLLGERKHLFREFWALRDVDLEVARGETIGIIGGNGAGKSTLLQLIAGTLAPTEGTIEVRGRVAALLELGSGFNPEFTGRENVFLNAQVLGLRRREVEDRFAAIAGFADLGAFIDEPVRTYSSGMMVRLAFSVAINTSPDLLIIDEALAVGDEAFQRKCYAKLEELRRRGTTVLFVSHAAQSVIQLCDRAMLIDHGRRLLTGRPKEVVSRYHRLLHVQPEIRDEVIEEIRRFDAASPDHVGPESPAPPEEKFTVEASAGTQVPVIRNWGDSSNERHDAGFVPESTIEYSPRGAVISDPHLATSEGVRVNVIRPNRELLYRYRVMFEEAASQVEFGMTVKSITGLALFGMSSHGRSGFIEHVPAGSVIEVEFRFLGRFQPGTYFLNAGCIGVVENGERNFLHRIVDATCFRVEIPATDRFMLGFYDLASEPSAVWRLINNPQDNPVNA